MIETDYRISRIDVSGDQVDLVIYGSGERPQLSELGDRLDASLSQPFNIKFIVLPSEREEYVDAGEKSTDSVIVWSIREGFSAFCGLFNVYLDHPE